jgi:hypothetical protein
VKQRCSFNQFIDINDDQTSNLPSIYVKWRQVKHTTEKGKWEGERNRESRLKEREKYHWLKGEMAWVEMTVRETNT